MCSIEGTTDRRFNIEKFCQHNLSRGPDGTNTYIGRDVQFGHNLLKISPNQKNIPQPFVTDKGNVLCYNGEIYGLNENVFDTEWLADRIENEGVESLARGVNGMWAFAWYNASENSITLCRDHFGQKPLYYITTNANGKDHLHFSSTIFPLATVMKALGQEVTAKEEGVDNLIRNNGFNFGDCTPYRGIQRIMPGQILKIDLKEKFQYHDNNLWKLDDRFNLFPNYMWNKEEFEHITKKAISQVCNAPDIRKTISLSGGLDSSLIASIARDKDKISACSVEWENVKVGSKDPERHLLDQNEMAKQTCRKNKLKHNVIKITHDQKDDKSIIEEIRHAMMFMPSWDLQRLMPRFVNITQAAAKGNKIYITGDCADEILTGYNGDYNKWCDPKIHEQTNNLWYLTKEKFEKRAEDNVVTKTMRKYLNTDLFSVDTINNGNFYNLLQHCDGFCTVLDSMCGYYGMESRTPFLHQEFVKYALKIPGQEKLRIPFDEKERKKGYKHFQDHQYFMLGHYKSLLRDNFKGHYVDKVRYGYRKIGFSNPWNSRDGELNNTLITEGIPENRNLLNTKLKIFDEETGEQLLRFITERPYALRQFNVDFKEQNKYNTSIKLFEEL